MKNYLTLIILFLITNLLLAQQNPLLKNYDVKFYKLDINVNDTSTYIEGNVAINAIVQNNPLDTLVVELIDTLSVDSVIFNGVNISFTHDYDEIKVPV
ncbi:MAG: hypothetical protein KAW86_03250, partial [Bacteroidales bacterium]|nr:hypothetical protein [Bacteroidales bacterium]